MVTVIVRRTPRQVYVILKVDADVQVLAVQVLGVQKYGPLHIIGVVDIVSLQVPTHASAVVFVGSSQVPASSHVSCVLLVSSLQTAYCAVHEKYLISSLGLPPLYEDDVRTESISSTSGAHVVTVCILCVAELSRILSGGLKRTCGPEHWSWISSESISSAAGCTAKLTGSDQ